MGNMFEWYEFALYSAMVPPITGKVFFNIKDEMSNAIAGFMVYGIAYTVRPIGTIFFGYFGDKYGKKALFVSLFIMFFSTFSIGLIPSYQEIGVSAAIILLMLKIF